MRASDILAMTPAGLWCAAGGFHVDPVSPVARALITHGHSDHAHSGHESVLATAESLAIMAVRYGAAFAVNRQAAAYGVPVRIGDVDVSFYPAGHVLGSAQIAISHRGYRVVISGDYKRSPDPTAAPFEVVRCEAFISEATFGLPVFRHPPVEREMMRLLESLRLFPERTHLVGAYALGKAQRVMRALRDSGHEGPVFMHGALENLTRLYMDYGIDLGDVRSVASAGKDKLACSIVIAPPSALADRWSRRFADPVACFASGWMRVRARARQRGVDLPLIISDHADWDELTTTIRETGCEELWVTHGQEDALVHWARLRGIVAEPLRLIGYGDEEAEA